MSSRSQLLKLLAAADGPLPPEFWEQVLTLDLSTRAGEAALASYLRRSDVPAGFASLFDARWAGLSDDVRKALWGHLSHSERLEYLSDPARRAASLFVAAVMLPATDAACRDEIVAAILGPEDGSTTDYGVVVRAMENMAANTALPDEIRARVALVAAQRWLSRWALAANLGEVASVFIPALRRQRPGRAEILAELEPPESASTPQLRLWMVAAAPAHRYDGDAAVFAQIAARILSHGFDDERGGWVAWLAAQVCEDKSRLPKELRAAFLEAAAEVDSDKCSAAIRKLTRRPAPDRTAAGVRDALAELTGGGTDRSLRARLAAAAPQAGVPAGVVDEVVSCMAVDAELAWQYVDRFAPNAAATHLAGLRPGDASWVAQVVCREPSLAVLDAADTDTLAAAAPLILVALDGSSSLTGAGSPGGRFLTRLVEVAGAHLDDVPFDVMVHLAEVVPAAGKAIAARMSPAPALALELVEGFAGTLGEFSALLACSADT